jgi:hypothetical protein
MEEEKVGGASREAREEGRVAELEGDGSLEATSAASGLGEADASRVAGVRTGRKLAVGAGERSGAGGPTLAQAGSNRPSRRRPAKPFRRQLSTP